MIKNIILDVGKVLVEWEPRKAMQELGFDEATIQVVAGNIVESELWNEVDRGARSDEELLAELIAKAPEYEREMHIFWDNVGRAIRQYSYAKTWIRTMKEKGYRVYILSNYGHWTFVNTQEALSFLADVDGAVFSYEVKQIKPNADIYHTLLQKYGLQAEECVFLDDRVENIEAARAQGMHGIVFSVYEDALQKLAEYGVVL